jgi:hypothetical protein
VIGFLARPNNGAEAMSGSGRTIVAVTAAFLVGLTVGVWGRLPGSSGDQHSSGAGNRPDQVGLPDRVVGNLLLFVLAGQSNMSGRGEVPLQPPPVPDAYTFGNDYRWRAAVEPIDSPRDQVDEVSMDSPPDAAGFGPGLSFAEAVRDIHPDRAIGLIPCAKGDTTIAEWRRNLNDRTLYGSCLKRVRAASLVGDLAGILFFQGEADAVAPHHEPDRDLDATAYARRFAEFAAAFRVDVGNPHLPFVFAQIGTQDAAKYFAHWDLVREQQASVQLPCSAMIRTDDLPLRDVVHFTTRSYRTIGQRFAVAYGDLIGNGTCN